MHEALKHVANAAHHAHALADEAEDLRKTALAARLREIGDTVIDCLDRALTVADEVEPKRQERARVHSILQAAYEDSTRRLRHALDHDTFTALCPGGVLDVAERMRFRVRMLEARSEDSVAHIREAMRCALERYDNAVDLYLSTCAAALVARHRAVVEGQRARRKLEQAKSYLLTRATPGSDTFKRIKRRAVRTRPPSWLAQDIDTLKNRLLITLSDDTVFCASASAPQ